MDKILVFVGTVAIILIAATGAYIGGRILLPEMGLSAPPWSAWLWAIGFTTAAGVLSHWVVSFIREL